MDVVFDWIMAALGLLVLGWLLWENGVGRE